ncbi:hypothetical protein GGR56DRAFT_615999 [Xylariaceae sp. FL0804]|nr:hypothetical protein GGR56DRAFT_615999 [Xylariaceae sp. FL0804]
MEPMRAETSIFPDGYKTSGMLEPIYSQVMSYEKFPTEITGPTVWKASDHEDSPEAWQHAFTAAEILEIGAAADEFIASGTPLTGIAKV